MQPVESPAGRDNQAVAVDLEAPAVSGPDGPNFAVSTVCTPHETVVSVAGELDCATAGLLDIAIDEALAIQPACVLVDFAGVTFVDPAGIRPIIRARISAPAGCEVWVRNASSRIRYVFGLLRLDHLLAIE